MSKRSTFPRELENEGSRFASRCPLHGLIPLSPAAFSIVPVIRGTPSVCKKKTCCCHFLNIPSRGMTNVKCRTGTAGKEVFVVGVVRRFQRNNKTRNSSFSFVFFLPSRRLQPPFLLFSLSLSLCLPDK